MIYKFTALGLNIRICSMQMLIRGQIWVGSLNMNHTLSLKWNVCSSQVINIKKKVKIIYAKKVDFERLYQNKLIAPFSSLAKWLSVRLRTNPANICWSWRHLQDIFQTCLEDASSRLQRNNFTSSKTSWRRIENVLQRHLEDVLETSWRHLARRLEDVLKTYLEDVLKTLWRETKYLLEI